MNFCVAGADHREILARVPSPVGVHRLAPLLEAIAEVVAAGERPAGTAQHDDLDLRVPLGHADGGLDFVGHRRDDGVELVRAVQRDGRDGPRRRVQKCLEIGCRHSRSEAASDSGVKSLGATWGQLTSVLGVPSGVPPFEVRLQLVDAYCK
jgi:hypothetical protein